MAHTNTNSINYDQMAAKMMGHQVIPVSGYSDNTLDNIKALVQAFIDLGATARVLTAGGVTTVTLYKSNGANVISVVESDSTQIPINGNVGGIVDTYDENAVPVRLTWEVQYLDQPTIG